MPRYTDEQILAATEGAESIFHILRKIGARQTGGSHQHLKRRLVKLGVDVKSLAYKGTRFNHGRVFINTRRTPESILVKRTDGRRQFARLLRRAMIESGVLHQCVACGSPPEWRGAKLVLQVDHKNEDWLDDRLENLQFMCPNCHSQKVTPS